MPVLDITFVNPGAAAKNGVRTIVALVVVIGIARADHPRPPEQQKAIMDASRGTTQLREAEEDYRRGLQAADGVGIPRDYVAAAKYYQKAAEKGYVPAQYNLAFLYENGMGVKQDFVQAVFWYRRAADQGDAEAQNNLGTLYATGQGVPLDCVEAVRLYRLAAAQDDLEGMTNLASMYLQGRGVERDTALAFQVFTKAAERGYAVAQNNLALMYANGESVKRDFVRAYLWLDLAAAEIPKAATVRDDLAKEMTSAQLAQARQLAAQRRKSLQAEGNKR
jgi:TPR repeat protein